jgi:hypothetical protein
MENTLVPAIMLSVLSVACIIIILAGLKKALQKTGWELKQQQSLYLKTGMAIIAWVVLVGIMAINGFFKNFSLPPRIMLIIVIAIIIILSISFTKRFIHLLKTVPPHWLVLIQSFRILVELILWQAFIKGLLPVQMTFEGNNIDILSGILGLLAGWLMITNKNEWKKIAVVYNIIGLGLLMNILVIAVLSMPSPIRYFMNEPSNTIVAEFPFIYLPAVLVIIALTFHIISLRQVVVMKSA